MLNAKQTANINANNACNALNMCYNTFNATTNANTTMQNAILNALQQNVNALCANSNIIVDADGQRDVLMGYGGCTVANAQAAISATVQQLQATDVDYDNLYDTDGSEDTSVTFTLQGEQYSIVTCYGA